jgi:ABC-type multidrug transport system fused ATPase/permease subunit
VLGEGSVLQQGSYDELIKDKGVFYELVKNQL